MASIQIQEHIQSQIKRTFEKEYREKFNEEFDFSKKKENTTLKRVVMNVYGIKSDWI